MSDGWWQSKAGARRSALGSRLFGPKAEEDDAPPATLLRLPPWHQVEDAHREDPSESDRPIAPSPHRPVAPATDPDSSVVGRRSSVVSPARHREWPRDGFTIGTPVSRYGSVKLWRARSVNLRLLLFAMDTEGVLPPEGLTFTPRPGGPPRRPPGTDAHPPPPRPGDDLAKRLASLLQPPPELLLVASGPLEWPGPLFPYQRDGVRALVQSPHLLLGDEMGLGKSVMTIAALRLLLHRREAERTLVVTPASLLEQWRREFRHWAPELRVMIIHGAPDDRAWRWQYRAHVSLTSYETLRADFAGGSTTAPGRETWSVVVLDEAQKIKNRDTDLARVCKRLPRERSWALTGTPLENRPEDVVSILEFVTGDRRETPRPTAPLALRAALSQLQLRRRKDEVLKDLPPKIITDLVLPLTPSQRRAYERAEQEGLVELRGEGDGENRRPARIENVLALITRLKQICNFAPGGDASAKMEDLEARVEELAAARLKALVFTQYAGEESGARRIARRLHRFRPLLYTGDMGQRERSAVIARFNEEEDRPVLILSLQAGGQGLNLQRASYVFHFDRSWNPAIEQQAEGRSHRIGQVRPVHVYRYVMAETIEERIDTLLRTKTRLFEELVEGTSLDLSRLLDQRELFRLVGLDPPEPRSRDATGIALEAQVAALLQGQGYRIDRAGGRGDGGIDLIAEKSDPVGAPRRLFVQCKDTGHPAGVEVVRDLNGALPPGDRSITGVVVCPAGFTADARSFAALRQIDLWDADRLAALAAACHMST
jgi:superfamily II DNA or RNA helicase